jgi:hypothetical protein
VEDLALAVTSYADMTSERAAAIARVFDAHPYLRPLRVGGDPARIKVEPSMETVIESAGLPVEWLTVRRNERNGAYEGGSINLFPGRGGWMGEQEENKQWKRWLTGHRIEQSWLADTLEAPGALAEVAVLFEELVVAADAAYGCVTPRGSRRRGLYTAVAAKLPGVYWLNYFGPAFVQARPGLAGVTGARMLASGGVLIRTTDDPWPPYDGGVPAWQTEVRAIFGEAAFEWVRPNPALPGIEEHVAASPGTMEMPWVAWDAKKAADDRAKKYAAARSRLAKAVGGRTAPALGGNIVEWSTSFDLDDWERFAKYLARRLGGELTTAIGRAAISVITTVPLDEEDHILLDTRFGVVSMGWFIDDVNVVDLTLWGTREMAEVCDAWLA